MTVEHRISCFISYKVWGWAENIISNTTSTGAGGIVIKLVQLLGTVAKKEQGKSTNTII